MAKTENLLKVFDDYDNAGVLSANYSNEHIKDTANKLNTVSTSEGVQAVRSKVPQKVKVIVKIINSVADRLNAKLKAMGVGYHFDIGKVTFSAKNEFGKIDVNYNGQNINFNIKKLSKLPALEVYTLATTSLYNMAISDLEKSGNIEDKEKLAQSLKENKNNLLNPKDYEKATTILSKYLRDFIAKNYPDDFKKFNNIADFIAGQIIAESSEKDIEKILGKFFDTKKIDVSAIIKVDDFLGKNLSNARISYLSEKASELLIGKYDKDGNYIPPNKNDELVALSYHEQAEELMSTSLIGKFKQIDKNGDFTYSSEIKDFCVSYARKFFASNGLASIKITFNSKGALGSYYDSGPQNQSFNINLQKLNKIHSITELVMTLSHELTHAVDSSLNMAQGKFNEYGGGLLNDIDEDISRTTLQGSGLDLLKELKRYCYHINPNERHARINEISALEFMNKASEDDKELQGEVQKSIARFNVYQQRTVDMINNLPNKIAEFKSKLKTLGNVSNSDRKLIEDRIGYLEEMQSNGLSAENEVSSINTANQIMMSEAEKVVQEQDKNKKVVKRDEMGM